MLRRLIILLLIVGCDKSIEGRYLAGGGRYKLDISNVTDTTFYFAMGEKKTEPQVCFIEGNSSFLTDNKAVYKDLESDLQTFSNIVKIDSCIYTFNINNNYIDVSLNIPQCAIFWCGMSNSFIHKYTKVDE